MMRMLKPTNQRTTNNVVARARSSTTFLVLAVDVVQASAIIPINTGSQILFISFFI